MGDQFSNGQQIRKPAVASKGGIVAAQSRKAAEVGAAVMAEGGDCIDAVIATTFALGVLEPWMSGVGGGGAMVLYRAREDRYEVIDYGMRSPGSLRPQDYPLAGDGAASDIFPWARVKDDRNLHGPGSIAVPGVVAGMEEAHRRYAKLPWQELLSPSVGLAGEGLLVDWWTTLMIASSAADLRRYPASAEAYLEDGLPPNAQWGIKTSVRLPQDRLKATLSYLAAEGPRVFYQGDLARSIAADVHAGGGALSVEGLASFRAYGREALSIPIAAAMCMPRQSTCGPTLAHTLRMLQANLNPGRAGPDAAAYSAYALALQSAYRERLQDMGDAEGRRACGPNIGAGLHHALFRGRWRGQYGGSDANLVVDVRLKICAAADRHYDEQRRHVVRPTPGGPNSLAPGKRCLTDSPVLVAGGATAGAWRSAPGRAAHPAGGDADTVLRDGLWHGSGCGHPPASPRCQRRGGGDWRRSSAGTNARSIAGTFRV